MASQSEIWKKLANDLNIEVVAPFERDFAGGKRVRFAAMLPQFGGPSGFVIDPNWEIIEPVVAELGTDGFGFSCVELGEDDEGHQLIDMLRDWTWTSATTGPDWLQDS